jgi:hypothetical protein
MYSVFFVDNIFLLNPQGFAHATALPALLCKNYASQFLQSRLRRDRTAESA